MPPSREAVEKSEPRWLGRPVSANCPQCAQVFDKRGQSRVVIFRKSLAVGRRHVHQLVQRRSLFGQLWRWAPSASSGGPPAAAAAACAASAAVVNGHTAGIAISVLLLVVVTALTAMTAQALGVVPACGLPGCPPRGAPSIGPAGFYSSSSKSAISGGYVAPSDAI